MRAERDSLVLVTTALIALVGGFIVGSYRPFFPADARLAPTPGEEHLPAMLAEGQPVSAPNLAEPPLLEILQTELSEIERACRARREPVESCAAQVIRVLEPLLPDQGASPSESRAPSVRLAIPDIGREDIVVRRRSSDTGRRQAEEQPDDDQRTTEQPAPIQGPQPVGEGQQEAEEWPVRLVEPPPLGSSVTRGSQGAPVTVHIFADFLCPYSRAAHDVVRQMEAEHPDRILWVFKAFPVHRDSYLAHRAALAAGAQGRFWEYHDRLFDEQRVRSAEDLEGLAQELGLDIERFRADLNGSPLEDQVRLERQEGRAVGVIATPTFLVNGEYVAGLSSARLRAAIERHLQP